MSTSEERRERRASRTRREIIEAGAELFEQFGFSRTTVEQIAERADVSPATVYAIAGGKAGVLTALVDEFHDASVAVDVAALLAGCTRAEEVVTALGVTCAAAGSNYHRTLHIVFDAAPNDAIAKAALDRAEGWFRPIVQRFADRLVELRGSTVLDPSEAAEVLWFFFGWGAWETMRRDYDWSMERRRDWLIRLANAALS